MTPELTQLAVMAAVLLGVGLFGGILAGLLGVGGGIIIVPVLYHLLDLLDIDSDVAMQLAVGTSLSTIIPTSIMSMRAHLRKDAVDVALLKSWGPAIAFGVLIGAVLIGLVEGEVLIAVFAVTAAVVALHMAFAPESLRLSDHLPGGIPRFGIGTLIGLISTMMGIGGGTLTVPTLVLCSYPIRRAVGTASAIGLIIAFPGTIGAIIGGWGNEELPPFSLGNVNLVAFAILAPATMLAAPWGARLAHAIPTRALRAVFALFLGITSARMFIDLLT
ncbi:sulfite exporter TauE/SafE family protein [Skermanella sp. TT6]|nr:sulfite exporter TauE/SafE family protein [Skermanella sp. TT6]